MSLLDDLRNLLSHHKRQAEALTQQGTVRLIEDHLKRLDAAAGAEVDKADAEVHTVLGELYGALNAPAPEAPPAESTKPATKKAASSAADAKA